MDKTDASARANGQPFTTKDMDNDNYMHGNCAVDFKSAWWFNACNHSDFNTAYNGYLGKMAWRGWRTDISKSYLMIRRTSK